LRVLFVSLFIVFADQLTKLYVKGISIPQLGIEIPGMSYQSSINVIGNFFKITYIENPGMAFGIQLGGKLFLSLFTIFATLLLFVFLYKNRKESLVFRLALAFILGGAVGNLIDRVFYGKIYGYAPFFYGKVVDFLHFDFPNFTIFGKTIYSWPIFNIADIAVSVGFILILIGYRKIFKKEEDKEVIADGGVVAFESSIVSDHTSNFTDGNSTEMPDNKNDNRDENENSISDLRDENENSISDLGDVNSLSPRDQEDNK